MSKHNRSRSRRPSRHDLATQSMELVVRPQGSWPGLIVKTVWRWRWEITWLFVGLVIWSKLQAAGLNGTQAVLTMVGSLVGILCVPVLRRWMVTRFWVVMTQHRLRSCMAEMGTLNYSGNLPMVLLTRSTKVGESVWLWMRPGLSITDLENRTEHIAAACWARDVRVERNRRTAALVRIDVIRRDPLLAPQIDSPLLGTTSDVPLTHIDTASVVRFLRNGHTPTTSEPASEASSRVPDPASGIDAHDHTTAPRSKASR